jgi:phosphohistidine phosphatase
MRHGEAATPAGGGEKALTDTGRRQASQSAALLAPAQSPQLVLHSPKLRAVQTMEQVRQHLDTAIPGLVCEETSTLLPQSNPQAVEDMLSGREQDCILLVSHLPLVAELVAWFSSGERGAYPLPGYSPAGLVALECDPVAARGCGAIAWYAFGPDYLRQLPQAGGAA